MALEGSESGALLRRMSGAPEAMAGPAEAAARSSEWAAGGVVGSDRGTRARVVGSGGGSAGGGSVGVAVPRGSDPGSRSWPGSGPGSGPGSDMDCTPGTTRSGGSFLSYERLARCGNGRIRSNTLRTAVARTIGAAENGRPPDARRRAAGYPGTGVIEHKHSTDVESAPPPPRVYVSIHTGGKSCGHVQF
jgi:hypothetical protein